MSFVPYEWQTRFLKIYNGKGVVKAFAGTGKTYATILLLKDRKYNNCIVAVPTRKLRNQWNEELKKYGVTNTFVETFHILSKDRSAGLKTDISSSVKSFSLNEIPVLNDALFRTFCIFSFEIFFNTLSVK